MNKRKAISVLMKMNAIEPLDMMFKYIQTEGSPPIRLFLEGTQQVLHPALLVNRSSIDLYEERAMFDTEDDEILVVSFAPKMEHPLSESEKSNPSFLPHDSALGGFGHCIILIDWSAIVGIGNASSNMQSFIDMFRP